jgi:CRP-like cAMP-binding protein
MGRNDFFEKFAAHAVSRRYENGEDVFSQGDAADAMFLVELGYVKLAVASKRSNKAAIAILRAGDCFGEGCLVEKSLRTCSAISIQESTVARVGKRDMIRQLRDDRAFSTKFVSYLLLRISRVEEDLADQLVNSSEKRLARLLLQLSGYGKLPGDTPELLTIDQGTLAAVVGTTRSRVSHFMNEFRKKGFIDYNGSLHVHKALLTYLQREPTPGARRKTRIPSP